MINKREIRISIAYFSITLIMLLVILFIRRNHLLSASINIQGIIVVCILVFIIFSIFPCIIFLVKHIRKAIQYEKVYYMEKHYAEWIYDSSEWRSLIIRNFKNNSLTEIKSFKRAGKIYFSVTLIAILLDMLFNAKQRSYVWAYLIIMIISFLLFFAIDMIKNIISLVDNILFTNHKIILMTESIIINDQIYNLNIPLKQELIKKQIRYNNLEIEYAVPSKSAGRYDIRHYLEVKDIKKIILPIPKGRYEEAKKYVNAALHCD